MDRHASHCCIRLLNRDIKTLFPKVPLGTRVYIEGPILSLGEGLPKTLVRRDRGSLVLLDQNRRERLDTIMDQWMDFLKLAWKKL
ncbi:L,D-transpeptidase [Polycladomyces abyssicola]|uniref:L,D-transpeptidase n=1 Tax=Polycladomyces abyssicola TaxID=1125966 RepID=UPI001BB2E1FF